MTKNDVVERIQQMPEEASLADTQSELYVRQKVEVGLTQAERGETISHEAAKQKLSRWLI